MTTANNPNDNLRPWQPGQSGSPKATRDRCPSTIYWGQKRPQGKAHIRKSGLSLVGSNGWTTYPVEKEGRANNLGCAKTL